MAKLQLDKGRILQKLKTRQLLIVKANELLKNGMLLSVEQTAKETGISKATAYRYFASLDALKREASLQLKAREHGNLFSDLAVTDLNGRLERLITYHFKLLIENETEFRLFLSSVISASITDPKTYTHGGRRIALITEALAPLQDKVSKNDFNNMINTLSIVFGIESVTVLKDLCGLNNKRVLENWRWTVKQVVALATQ